MSRLDHEPVSPAYPCENHTLIPIVSHERLRVNALKTLKERPLQQVALDNSTTCQSQKVRMRKTNLIININFINPHLLTNYDFFL
jgi:hypothetical protein